MQLHGSCHCGAVRFSVLSHTPYPFMLCYCSICRKTAGGGGYAINLMGEYGTLTIRGRRHTRAYQATIDGELSEAERYFCGRCGSALWLWDPRWPELVHPFASAIDSELPPAPQRAHVMLDSTMGWIPRPRPSRKNKTFAGYGDDSIEGWRRARGALRGQGMSAPGGFEAPLDLGVDSVRPEWIDYNGHMNVAYYVLVFDYATDRLYDRIGLGEAYIAAHRCSTFTLESHIIYLQEARRGDALRFSGQLLDYDTKRIHWYCDMHHRDEGYHAAALEFLTIHVDMENRRSAPFPADVLATLGQLKAAHASLPPPELAGRTIGIRRATD